jgi:hypothetical protein
LLRHALCYHGFSQAAQVARPERPIGFDNHGGFDDVGL